MPGRPVHSGGGDEPRKVAVMTSSQRKHLRHTFASWAIRRGANLQEVKDLLGHRSLAMTLRYGHLAPEHLRTAVARLDAALSVPAKLSAQASAQESVTEGVLVSK